MSKQKTEDRRHKTEVGQGTPSFVCTIRILSPENLALEH